MHSFFFLPALFSLYFLLRFHSTFSIFFPFLVSCFLYIRISIPNLQFLVFFFFPLRRVLILATSLLQFLSVVPSVHPYACDKSRTAERIFIKLDITEFH
jgi:hypothetical protein